MEKINLFVYGTLKKGFRLHSPFRLDSKDSKPLGEGRLLNYALYQSRYSSIPFVSQTNESDKVVYGEIYQVSKDVFQSIRWMEESAGYNTVQEEILTSNGKKIKCNLFSVTPAFLLRRGSDLAINKSGIYNPAFTKDLKNPNYDPEWS